MLLQVEFGVKSNIHLDDYWEIKDDIATYNFELNTKHLITKFIITLHQKVDPIRTEKKNGIHSLIIPPSVTFARQLAKTRAKEINDSLSIIFLQGYIEIDINPNCKFIPENDEDRKALEFNYYKKSITEVPNYYNFNAISKAIFFSKYSHQIKTPLLLCKSAAQSFANENYRYAFYDFYLVLEYWFAKGQSGKGNVKKRYMEENIVINAFTKAKEALLCVYYFTDLSFRNTLKDNVDIEPLIDDIIDKRQNHFHQNHKKQLWSVENKSTLQDEATFMKFVIEAIMSEISGFYNNDDLNAEIMTSNRCIGVRKNFQIVAIIKTNVGVKEEKMDVNYSTRTLSKRSLYSLALMVENKLKNASKEVLHYDILLNGNKVYCKKELDAFETILHEK